MKFEGRNISVGYGQQPVLNARHVQVKSGECCFLLGMNGSGKSTLLRTLATLQKPLKGELRLNDNLLSKFSLTEISKRVCFVQSQSARVDYLKVFDYIALGRMPYTGVFGALSAEDLVKVLEAIKLLGIEGLKEREVLELSDGEFQKVKLAQAFCQETDILFVDEPAAHLDIASKFELFHLLRKMAKEQNRAIVVSTHEVEIALSLADSVWLIQKGDLQIGSAKAFLAEGLIDEVFGNQYVSFAGFEERLKEMKVV